MQEELQLSTAVIMPFLAEILSLEGKQYEPILTLSYCEVMNDPDYCLKTATYTFSCIDDQNDNIVMEISSPEERFGKISEENSILIPCENYQKMISLSDFSSLIHFYLLDHPILIKFYALLEEVQQVGNSLLTADICGELYGIMKNYMAEMVELERKEKVHYR